MARVAMPGPERISMKPREYYESLLSSMPMGAERIVLRVLSFHIGLKCAIQKPDLISESAKHGAHFSNERQVRLTIVDLRKQGVPVCASSGESGYYLAGTLEEYKEFRGREYVKKIVDMRETVTAMDDHVKQMFPGEYEAHLKAKAEAAGQPSLI
jgi:hypothetical protein